MENVEELKKILYDKYGAFALKAYEIIKYCKENNNEDEHKVTNYFGYSFKFVREVLDLFKQNNEIKNFNLKSENDLPKNEDEQVLKALRGIYKKYNYNNRDFDHILATEESILKRAKLLSENYDKENCKFLFLGDHDLTSIAFALYCKMCYGIKCNAIVVDIDEKVLAFIDSVSKEFDLNIITAYADFRFNIPKCFMQSMDVIFTDPPYTPEGITAFLSQAINLCKSTYSIVYLAYKSAETSAGLGLQVQKSILKLNMYIYALMPNFNQYYSAEALGYRSDLYKLFLTAKCNTYLSKNCEDINIYTHGENAIEAKKETKLLSNEFSKFIKTNFKDKVFIINATRVPQKEYKIITLNDLIEQKLQGKTNFANKSIIYWMGDEKVNYEQFYKSLSFIFDCEFYLALNKKAKNNFLNSKIANLLQKLYVIKNCETFEDVDILKFSFIKDFQSKQDEIFASTLKYVRSGIRNAFVDVATKILESTKNEARQLFDEVNAQIKIYPQLLCNEITTDKLLEFSKRLNLINLN